MPLVSIVIPCYNYARYLPEAVASVAGQTYRDFEIIIVNDGSADDTAEVAERLAIQYPGCRITVVNQPNQGASAARNNGIRLASGEYIVALDADDMIAPTFLEETICLLSKEPVLGIVYTDMVITGPDIDTDVTEGEEYEFRTLVKRNFIPTCNLFRKAAWEAAGGYKKLTGAEDWELWIAMGELGYHGRHLPRPLYLHRVHGVSKYSVTSSRMRDVLLEIRKLHIEANYPGLCRRSRSAALVAVYIRYWITDPITHYIYRKHPRIHSKLRGVMDALFPMAS